MKSDKEIIDWLERNNTLHRTVQMLYVVDGYDVDITYDGSTIIGPFHGETIREACSLAMDQWDTTHGDVNLLPDRSLKNAPAFHGEAFTRGLAVASALKAQGVPLQARQTLTIGQAILEAMNFAIGKRS